MTTPQSHLVEGWQDAEVWSNTRLPPQKQFAAWRDFVVDAHMRWDIRPIRCDAFPAFMRQGRFDGYRVTHLTGTQGGIVGVRGPQQIAHDAEAFFNLIYIADGSISLTMGGKDIVLTPGQFTLWDTTRSMRFVTGQNLRQVTFAVPQQALRSVLPRADDYVGRPVQAAPGLSQLFVNHLLSLDQSFGELPRATAGRVLNATVELLAATLRADLPTTSRDRSVFALRQVMDYIEQHLAEPTLDTQVVARAYGISPRHLHRLFAGARTTPSHWIRQQRLERCRQELRESPQTAITEIAYRWGFQDSSTFSKVYRKTFGLTARQEQAAFRQTLPPDLSKRSAANKA